MTQKNDNGGYYYGQSSKGCYGGDVYYYGQSGKGSYKNSCNESHKENWISVLELDKLPDSLQDILFTDGHKVFKGYRLESLDKNSDMWCSEGHYYIKGVTHWMCLPQIPNFVNPE